LSPPVPGGGAGDAPGDHPVVVANPRAAGGKVGARWPRIRRVLEEELGPVEVRWTEGPGRARTSVRRLLEAGHRWIVSLGGDGTHGEVAGGFFDGGRPVAPEAALSILPVGTGGDFARMLELPRGDLRAAARAIARPTTTAVDVGQLTHAGDDGTGGGETVFLNVASAGLGGRVDRIVNRRSKALGGRLTFFAATVEGLFGYRPPEVTLTIDGEPQPPARVLAVAVCNGGWFGGGMHVAPAARLEDGLFDVVVLPWRGVWPQLARGLDIYRGAHLRHPGVEVIRCREVQAVAATGDEALLDVDGESPGRLPATFRLLPGALRLRGSTPRSP